MNKAPWMDKKRAFDDDIEKRLAPFLPEDERVIERLLYPLQAGGKRLRPLLLASTAALFAPTGGVEDFALAIECIHTYSLVHDDLPAMDDDALRRGLATCHVHYSEADAILIGDGLLNLAAELAAGAAVTDPSRHLRAMAVLFGASGNRGMIYGQFLDMQPPKDQDAAALDQINAHKTGALIEAACTVGAILGGADEADIDRCATYGRTLGRAFQIVDDLLDITGEEQVIGKPVGSDVKNNKKTLPVLLGLEASRRLVKRLTEEALHTLDQLEGDTTFLAGLTRALLTREV